MFDLLGDFVAQPMLEKILETCGHPGASVLFAVAWYPIFRWADKFFPTHTKSALCNRLNNLTPASWTPPVVSLFHYFLVGPNRQHSLRPSFWRSCCASLFWVTVLFCIFFSSNTSVRTEVLSTIERDGFLSTVGGLLSGAIILNLTVDYLSIFQTRIVLHWMTLQKSIPKILALVALDLIATAALVSVSFTAIINSLSNAADRAIDSFTCAVFQVCGTYVNIPLQDSYKEFLSGLTLDGSSVILSVYIYTAFLTSFWIWIYATSELILRSIPVHIRYWFPISKYPFQSIGCVYCILSGIAYFIVVGIFKVYS